MEQTTRGVTTDQTMPAPTTTVKVSAKDELDVWVIGEGTPVVLIHGAFIGSLLKPLAEELAGTGDYQAIWYQRRGYRGKPTGPAEVSEQARDVVKILDALEISKAHIVGHSAGAAFALAVTMEAPDRLLSGAFFDLLLPGQVKSGAMIAELLKPSIEKALAGDFEGGAAYFLAGLGATKELVERALPGSWSAMTKDAPTWFQVDMPALMSWVPDAAKFGALEVPLAFLSVSGLPPFRETQELLQQWQPNLTVLEISTDHHFFPVTATAETAEVIDNWIKSQGTAN